MIQLGEHFRDNNRSRHTNWLRRQRRQWFIKARRDHARKEDLVDNQANEILSFAVETVMATQIQIEQFEARLDIYEARLDAYEAKLDAYDSAITAALMENRELLDLLNARMIQVNADIQGMLDRAYKMEDGRRAFKSEDGITVIDEHGKIVPLDELDPNLIPNNGDTKELYLDRLNIESEVAAAITSANGNREQLLNAENEVGVKKDQLALAREKLEEAKSMAQEGNLTVEEIDGFDRDIENLSPSTYPSIPASAKANLPDELNPAANAPNAKTAFGTASSTPASPAPKASALAEPSPIN